MPRSCAAPLPFDATPSPMPKKVPVTPNPIMDDIFTIVSRNHPNIISAAARHRRTWSASADTSLPHHQIVATVSDDNARCPRPRHARAAAAAADAIAPASIAIASASAAPAWQCTQPTTARDVLGAHERNVHHAHHLLRSLLERGESLGPWRPHYGHGWLSPRPTVVLL